MTERATITTDTKAPADDLSAAMNAVLDIVENRQLKDVTRVELSLDGPEVMGGGNRFGTWQVEIEAQLP